MKPRKWLVIVLVLICTAWQAGQARAASALQNYDLHRGDFDGNGLVDVLYVAKDASQQSGIVVNDGSESYIPWQSWPSNYLGVEWSADRYRFVVADINGDGRSDIFLQPDLPGESLLLLTGSDGKVVGISQAIAPDAFGLGWSADQHRLIAGDFSGSGRAGLFLQATRMDGLNVVIFPDDNGQFTIAPRQTWNGGYLGLTWSSDATLVHAGDFNGDGRADLLLQAGPTVAPEGANKGATKPNMSGVVLAQADDPIFALSGLQIWSDEASGIDWSPRNGEIVIADVNGDGRDDVVWQPDNAARSRVVLKGNSSGAIFSPLTSGASGIPESATDLGRALAAVRLAADVSKSSAGGSDASLRAQSAKVAALNATLPVTAVGRTVGAFAVSDFGAGTYSIPIVVIPGRLGVQPKIELRYQSGTGNGLIGMGWNLAGLSEIERCKKTLVQDNSNDGVQLSTADRFCLDGNKLRLISGTYGAAGSTYRTELDTFSRITAHGTAGYGPAYFIVEGKDGMTYEYGNSESSRIEAVNSGTPTIPHTWALNTVTDRHGNAMEIRYQEDGAPNGSYRPTAILYGSNNTRVTFTYDTRPALDTLTGYVGGGAINETQRLSRIDTTYDGSLVRRYLLSYETSPNTRRSTLSTVQECSGEAGDVCLEPTTFGWLTGGVDWSTETLSTSSTSAQMEYSQAIDIDGDGRDDLVYPQGGKWWFMRATATGGFGTPTATNVSPSVPTYPINHLGDGRFGLLFSPPGYGTRQILNWNGATLVLTNTNITETLDSNKWVGDFDGDGLPDFLYATTSSGTGSLYWQKNLGMIAGVAQFAPAQNAYSVSLAGDFLTSFSGNVGNAFSRLIDFNGDGRADFLYSSTSNTCNLGICIRRTTWSALRSTGSSYVLVNSWYCETVNSSSCPVIPVVGDFNADGLTDIVAAQGGWQWGSTNSWDIRYGTGTGLSAPVSVTLPANFSSNGFATDYDGDGRQDLMHAPSSSGGNWYVMRSTGTGFEAAVQTNVPSSDANDTLRVMDLNGDGMKDIGYNRNGQYRARKHIGGTPDLMASINPGFDNHLAISYAPLTDGTVYTKINSTDIQPAMYVVKRYDVNSCALNCYSVTNEYRGAALDLQGRGFLGFQRRSQTDGRTGITTRWVYRQQFPYIGALLSTEIVQPNGNTISEVNNTHTDLVTSSTQYNDRHFPYVSSSRQTTYEVNATDSAVDGETIAQIDTSIVVDSYGNPTTITQTTTDANTGETFTTATTNTVSNDTTNWCLNFVTQQTLTKSRPGVPSQSRTVQYVKDTSNLQRCRVSREIADPNLSGWTVTTAYGYDGFGNVNSESVTASGIAARTTTMDYGVNGLAPVTITNAEGEITRRAWDHRYGVLGAETDPNGLITTRDYDEFGRKKHETHPDGTAIEWSMIKCNADTAWCGETLGTSLAFQIRKQQLDASGTVIRSSAENFDRFSRLRREDAQTLSGAISYVHTNYDHLDRVTGRSRPSFVIYGGSYYFTGYIYDVVGRPVREVRPTSEAIPSNQQTTYSYARSLHILTDVSGKVTTKQLNALGEVVKMTDAAGGATLYEYDAFGNLLKTTDPDGNQIVSTYYPVGLKQTLSDPDLGTWSYQYYPTGELKQQTNAKSQAVTLTYDRLARLRTRVEPEGTTTFTYGTSAAAWNIGKLVSASSPGGYSQTYLFDNKGRPFEATTNADASTFTMTTSYSTTTGMIETVTYPTSTSAVPGSRFKVQYEYAYGLLKQVRDFNTPSQVYWEKVATNENGQTTEELYGNGLHSYSTYDAVTGSLGTRTTGATAQVQYSTYQWDKAGNLTERKDHNLSMTEAFTYDDLYRLKTSKLNNVTNLSLTYTANGNIESKSDVGTYTYPEQGAGSVRPHAVTNAGSNGYSYDANGNMSTRNGSSITWYSYDLPSRINKGSSYAQFFYGADRSRYKQVAVTAAGGSLPAGTETTIYVGGLYEKVTKPSGVIEHKHYILAGSEPVAVRTLRTNSANDTRYLHKDHLGSLVAVTNESGTILTRLSYDAFGKRRDAIAWSGAPGTGAWTSIAALTHRSFTFHEHLDSVDLVHMNGRVYDPDLGRFISADPFIQAPLLSQSLNRYSYVMNNPLSLIDPSGYSWLSKAWKKLTNWAKDTWDGLRESFNFIVGAVLIVVGAITWNVPLMQAGYMVMMFPVQVGRNKDGFWITYGYGYDPPAESERPVIRGPSGSAPPMTAPPGAVSFTAPSAGHWRGGGVDTESKRRAVFDTAKLWLQSRKMIESDPKYHGDTWVVRLRKNVYASCTGADSSCGYPGSGWVGGITNSLTGNIEIYRGGLVRSRGELLVGDREMEPFSLMTNDLTALEWAIFVMAHENWHYMNRQPDEDLNYEAYANAAGWRALQAFRAWRRGY